LDYRQTIQQVNEEKITAEEKVNELQDLYQTFQGHYQRVDQELQNLKAQYTYKVEELKQTEADRDQISVKMRRAIE